MFIIAVLLVAVHLHLLFIWTIVTISIILFLSFIWHIKFIMKCFNVWYRYVDPFVIRCLHGHCCWSKLWHVWIDESKLIIPRTEFIIVFEHEHNIDLIMVIICFMYTTTHQHEFKYIVHLITYCKLIVWYAALYLIVLIVLIWCPVFFVSFVYSLCFAHVYSSADARAHYCCVACHYSLAFIVQLIYCRYFDHLVVLIVDMSHNNFIHEMFRCLISLR
jgi:hypothetical protein